MELNIKVIARVKPLPHNDVEGKSVHISSERDVTLKVNGGLFTARQFRLDRVLDDFSTQDDVFKCIVPLMQSALEGFNCTVFMYGQTGSGKTHTMLGYDLWEMAKDVSGIPTLARDEHLMGIIPRGMLYLFSEIETKQIADCTVSVSYLELYNDMKLFDLLGPNNCADQKLEIRENKSGEIIIPGLTSRSVSTTDEVLEALWSGAQFRHVAATDMNEYSSRSHTIFIVRLELLNPLKPDCNLTSKLHFVDLAGSEKWKSSQLAALSAERVKELTSINRSLSALGNCVSALMRKNRSHVPYRDSKLTRLLQDSLGGNTLTLFVVTISASIRDIEETASTLQFADRAMKVQILAIKNTLPSTADSVDKLKLEIRNLKALLQSTLSTSGGAGQLGCDFKSTESTTLIESLNNELQELKEENIRILNTLKSTQEQLQQSQEENIMYLRLISKLSGSTSVSDTEVGLEARKPLGKSSLQQFPNDLKMSILQAREEEIDRRLQAAENIEVIQEERWSLLMNYHTWLQAQAGLEAAGGDSGVPATDVYKRVQLMEGSIIVQADELRRAKKVFLQTNSELHSRLSLALQENLELRKKAIPDFISGARDITDAIFEGRSEAAMLLSGGLQSPDVEPVELTESVFPEVEEIWGIQSMNLCHDLNPAVSKPPSPISAPALGSRVNKSTRVSPVRDSSRLENRHIYKHNNISTAIIKSNKLSSGETNQGVGCKKKFVSNNERAKMRGCAGQKAEGRALGSDSSGVNSEISDALARADEIFNRQRLKRMQLKDSVTAHEHHNTEKKPPIDIITDSPGCTDGADKGPIPAADNGSKYSVSPAASVEGIEKEIRDDKGSADSKHLPKKNKKSSRPKKQKLLWQQCIDHASGQPYYYNRKSQETTWDRPPEEDLEMLFIESC